MKISIFHISVRFIDPRFAHIVFVRLRPLFIHGTYTSLQ